MMSALFRLEALPSTIGSPEDALVKAGAAQRVALSMADGKVPPPSLRTEAWIWWTPAALTVCFAASFRGKPPRISGTVGAVRTRDLWAESEVCEFFIGRAARETGRYREYEIAPDGRWIVLDIAVRAGKVEGNQETPTGVRCAAALDAPGSQWRAAVEIPWSDLDSGPGDGPWDCNLYRSIPQPNAEQLLAWSPTGYGTQCFHRPGRFGVLVLRTP